MVKAKYDTDFYILDKFPLGKNRTCLKKIALVHTKSSISPINYFALFAIGLPVVMQLVHHPELNTEQLEALMTLPEVK